MRRALCLLTTAFVLCTIGCGSDDRTTLTINGSSTMAPLLEEIADRFEARHPDIRVDVQTGGSSRGIADVRNGLADIGMSSRALTAKEKAGRLTQVLAHDGVAFVVHRDNSVNELTRDQLRSIYSGEVNHWNEVGGSQSPINAINRADGRSELKLFAKLFGLKSSSIHADSVAGENQQGLKMVAGDPNAIIYISLGAARYEVSQGAPLKLLPLDGVAATSANVRNGSYRFHRPLVLITPENAPALTRHFIQFALSANMHDLVEEHGFIPADAR